MTTASRAFAARCFRYRTRRVSSSSPARWPRMGVELISTGGTAAALARRRARRQGRRRAHRLSRDDGRPGEDAASQGARRAARRARQRGARRAGRQQHGIAPIDLLVVNLYPFEATVAQGRRLRRVHREHRHRRPGDDPRRGQEPCRRHGRRRARRTTTRVLARDARERRRDHAGAAQGARRQGLRAHGRLRRGDQRLVRRDARRGAARLARLRRQARRSRCATARTRISGPPSMRSGDARPGVATAVQHQGKELSYNNLNDTDAAFELVAEFAAAAPAVAIIKHANPCGVATGGDAQGGLSQGAALRSGQRLRRHRRARTAPSTRRRPRRSPRSSPRW